MAPTIGGRALRSCREERIVEQAADRRSCAQEALQAAEPLPAQFEQVQDEDIPRLAQGMPGIESLRPRRGLRGCASVPVVLVATTEQGRGE